MSEHLASIDLLRIVLCLSVVSYHVVEETAALFLERGAPWERSGFIMFIYVAAPPAVDVFWMLAGCFCARGCAKIAGDETLDAREKWSQYAARIACRAARMCPRRDDLDAAPPACPGVGLGRQTFGGDTSSARFLDVDRGGLS